MYKTCETKVVNIKRDEYDIRIDRKSRWGNPYPMRKEADREGVIAKYRIWLWAEIKSGRITLKDLAALHGKRLACHCAPKSCHGHVLADAAKWAYRQRARAA